ncbi:phage tail protein [Bradyrhizobium ivorense]|uniref:phage tail protein n=1 Tax=Bradyrhizobium ivorense TaxID=2511166 RepID=UPI0010B0312F|nr:tail fiber protein [Bradyrhizobium ivorense]VIO77396.1 hypothetical protein CI41S_56510 [Bradyrhizobium ivorense]
MTLYKWSRDATNNATIDSTINWQEGQAPSSINDSARAVMASVAKWRDDITGVLVAGGSGTAYAISSNQGISTNIDGFTVQFTPGATNTGAVTLSVDGQASRPIRFRTGVDLPAGVLISGSLYQVTFRAAAQEWLLHSFDSSVYAIPIGASLEYWGTTAPNGAFAIPNGQSISRADYPTLFSLIGTTYGVGDGAFTFNLPNAAGRVVVQREDSPLWLSPTYFGDSTTLGFRGGAESRSLLTANLPPYTPTGSISGNVSGSATSNFFTVFQGGGAQANAYSPSSGSLSPLPVSGTISGSFSGNAQGGTSAPFATVQPTIIANRIMRII